MSKVTIVGRGTVGCLAVINFLKFTDFDIEWVFDPDIEPVHVGEGTTLILPENLFKTLGMSSNDMIKFQATSKIGIMKRDWGAKGLGNKFLHPFPIGKSGIHLSAVYFQDYIFNLVKNLDRVKIVESNIQLDQLDKLDSERILVCSGTPKNWDDYIFSNLIPVNSCFVSQCPWDHARFDYSLTYAMPWGWVFGIPLRNRCSIGYLFNEHITDVEVIKEDVKSILTEFELAPNFQRQIRFKNYIRKNNFSERVIYNGNASFFSEPLEATSLNSSLVIIYCAISYFNKESNDLEGFNNLYLQMNSENESIILMHYLAGSSFKNEFWNKAQENAYKKLSRELKYDNNFSNVVKKSLIQTPLLNDLNLVLSKNHQHHLNNENWGAGSWNVESFSVNIEGLGLRDQITSMVF